MFGTVQLYYQDRGYGFIKISFKERYFFHVENWRAAEAPAVGQRVEFDLVAGHKEGQAPQAVRIIVVDEVGR